MRNIFIFLCFAFLNTIIAQNNNQIGFDYLEEGKYEEAEIFFDQLLADTPNDRTARLCYARAIGLQGRDQEALDWFKALDDEYPDDYEIQLNIAEAYMWGKNFEPAKEIYKTLLVKDKNHFVANLGFANAANSLGQPMLAYEYINKALKVSPGNKSAETSKKYILLSLADSYRAQQDYKQSHIYLNEIEAIYPEDKDVLLTRAALYLSDEQPTDAAIVYGQLIGVDAYEAYNGLSYTNILKHRNSKAKDFAELAVLYQPKDGADYRGDISWINALGVNREFSKAHRYIDSLLGTNTDPSLQLAKARMLSWEKKYDESSSLYHQIPESFEQLMGIAEVERAKKNRNGAINLIKQALTFQNNQPDAVRLLHTLGRELAPKLSIDLSRAEDGGGNEANHIQGEFSFYLGDKHRLFTNVGLRSSLNEFSPNSKGQQRKITIGDEFIMDRNTSLRFAIGSVNNSVGERTQSKLLFDAALQRTFFNSHTFTVLYRQEPHNYTVDLIQSNIVMNHLGGTYNFGRPGLPGIYIQYLRTEQTDDNVRNLLFASAFYSLKEFPTIKMGVNYLRFSFDEQKPILYFSPDQYQNAELFAEFSNMANQKNNLTYRFFGAFGQQSIEENDSQLTRRIEVDLGYRFHPNLSGLLYYRHSNAAQSTATGFTFDQLGIKLAYLFYRM